MAIAIICLILLTLLAGAVIAALVLVVQRLPQSDYKEVDILSAKMIVAWERGYFMAKNNKEAAYVLPDLQLADRSAPAPEPEYERGPFDDSDQPRTILDEEATG